jgi:hypothetical protein
MATNLVELTKSYFTPELRAEDQCVWWVMSPPTTQRALEGAIPTLLAVAHTNLTTSGSGTTALTTQLN